MLLHAGMPISRRICCWYTMNARPLIVVAVFALAAPGPVVRAQTDDDPGIVRDFFPLTIGTTMEYAYQGGSSATGWSSQYGWGQQSSGVFGSIFLSVVDSVSAGGTKILWSIREKAVLTIVATGTRNGQPTEVRYTKETVEDYTLTEHLTGRHRLEFTSAYVDFQKGIDRYALWTERPRWVRFSASMGWISVVYTFESGVGLVTADASFMEIIGMSARSSSRQLRYVRTTTTVEQQTDAPTTISIFQNYPNPFNPTTTVTFGLAQAGRLRLTVFDLLGREIAVLVDEARSAGSYSAVWDAGRMPSGVYFICLEFIPRTAGMLPVRLTRRAVLAR